MNSPFHDDRAAGLLSRVRDDIAHLRNDVSSLLQHTTRHTLPQGARELAGSARQQLAAGGSYAATRLRSLRSSPSREAIGVIGGAVLVGVLAVGFYALCKSECCASARDEEEDSDELDDASI